MNEDIARELIFRMKRIRMVEESIADRYPEGKMRCPTHLSIGQEAVAAAAGMLMSDKDLAVSSHRSHAHYLGKGGNLDAMIAELHGKLTGCSKGKGGSMHLVDKNAGFIGSTAIVANTIPVGAGIALAMKIKGASGICCLFLGDGAIEEGVFYETVNFVALRSLPVIFLCENNFYSVYSPLNVRQPQGRKIHELVQAIGVKGVFNKGDGMDSLYSTLKKAFDEVRYLRRPIFVEIETFRWREHCGPNYDDNLGYRSSEEIQYWKDNDLLSGFQKYLLSEKIITPDDVAQMERSIMEEIDRAFVFAEESPFPGPEELNNHVYSISDNVEIPLCDN